MRTISFNINSTVTRLYLGVAGEQNATQVVIDCNDYAKEYGEGTAVLLHKRASDSVPYECLSVSQANNIVTWTITVDDTAYNGEGQLELRWTVDNVLKKSKIISTFVKRSLTPQEEEEIKSALELILEAIPTNVDRALAEAKESGEFDGVGITDITFNSDYTLTLTMTDGTEYTTDPIRGEKGEKGDTGNGISNVVLNPDYTLTITFTDGTEYTTTSIRGAKGETGTSITDITFNPNYTLTITMSDGETYTTGSIRGAKGETGTSITNVTLNSNYTLTITMSDGTSYTTDSIRGAKGDKGDTGSKGDKGTSIRSVTKTGTSGLVDTYTITYDDNTTSTFTVTNGQNATVEVTSDTDGDYRLTFTDVNGSIETPNLYSDVTASAKQLLSKSYTLDQVPYLYRQSPDSDRAVESIVGGTVGWNQLCNSASVTVTSGHKYYMVKGGVKSIGASTGTAITGLTSGTDIVTDLTTMLGSTIADYIYSLETATAGAGVAKLKEWGFFTENYYEYCEPTLKSVEGLVSKKTVGFNQWDEEWESGGINTSTGAIGNDISRCRSKNFIPCIPNMEYYFKSSLPIQSFYYDAKKEYIEYYSRNAQNTVRTTPLNCCFMKIRIVGTSIPSNDICINLSDPTRNGQYEPYESHSYPLDSTLTLRGIPKLDSNNELYFDGDTYESDGTVSRRFTERAYQSGDESLADAITDGTTTVVKLATSTTETATPYHNPQIVGDTERFVTTGIVPVGHSTKYYQNLRKKIEGLPWNFSSLIAPTEVTNKATRNYTTGSYLILNNVLYKVTANIANGGTISPNSNVTATTIMTEFMSL